MAKTHRYPRGGKKSKKRGKRGGGKKMSAQKRASLSRKGKARWRRLSAAEKKKVIARLNRYRKGKKRRKAKAGGKKGHKRSRRTNGFRDVSKLVAATRAGKSRRGKRGKGKKGGKRRWSAARRAFEQAKRAFGFGAKSSPKPKYTPHQSDYLARKREELRLKKQFDQAAAAAEEKARVAAAMQSSMRAGQYAI